MTGDEARSLIAAALRPAIEANWPNHELAPIEWRYGRWSDEYRRASSGCTQAIEDATTAVVRCLRDAGALDDEPTTFDEDECSECGAWIRRDEWIAHHAEHEATEP